MKLCRTCNTEKDSSCFHKRVASNDGLSTMCKECQSAYDRQRATLPHRVEARKVYASTKAGKKAGNKAKKKWAENNLIKRAANVIVGNAIRSGKLVKQACEVCGEQDVHGHHDDYAKPLNVRWLCAAHHQQWHSENGEGANA